VLGYIGFKGTTFDYYF